jgi:cell division septal protein FtsQ
METKDIKKTEVKRDISDKRKRSRRRRVPFVIYFFIILILVFLVFVTLSCTVMFNVKHFEITGDADMYTAEEIRNASGIENMENMVKLDSEAAEQRILNELDYIETAKITKKFPDTICIEVVRCTQTYQVEYDGGMLMVSGSGKIVSRGTSSQGENTVTFTGFEPDISDTSNILKSKDEQKEEIFYAVVDAIKSGVDVAVNQVDMSDKYSITILFDNRIKFDAGSWADMDYKISLAETAISELDSDAIGYLTMIGSNQVSFRTEKSVQETKLKASKKLEETTESTDEVDDQ